MSALDNDDHWEGNNARLVYSLEKNVIDENSGRPIFAVNSERGLIKTALCCLDREKTPRYVIQVVATDGGGLKGRYCYRTPTKEYGTTGTLPCVCNVKNPILILMN